MAMAEGHNNNVDHSKPSNSGQLSSGPLSSGLLHYLRTDNDSGHRPSWRRPRFTVRLARYLCASLIGLLFIVCVVIFLMWISIQPHKPRVFLDYASVVQLNVSSLGLLDDIIDFRTTFRNSNEKVGIHYDNIDVEAIYNYQKIAWSLLPEFYQGPKNTTVLQTELYAKAVKVNGETADELAATKSAGKIGLELKVRAKTSFKVGRWSSRGYTMSVKCSNVVIDLNGAPFQRRPCMVYF